MCCLCKDDTKGISETGQKEVARLLIEFSDVLSSGETDVGKIDLVQHSIPTILIPSQQDNHPDVLVSERNRGRMPSC